MVRKIIQPWWIRKQIALTVARLPSWGLRCCRPREPLSEPRRGEFRRRAANRRANRTGNAACQEIVFESSWRYILHISFLNAHLLALRTRSIPRSKELGQFLFGCFWKRNKKVDTHHIRKYNKHKQNQYIKSYSIFYAIRQENPQIKSLHEAAEKLCNGIFWSNTIVREEISIQFKVFAENVKIQLRYKTDGFVYS